MGKTIERVTVKAGLVSFAALLLSSCVASQPGSFLASYPDADSADDAKTHVYSSVTDVRPMMSLQAYAEKVADEIEAASKAKLDTGDAEMFQYKAVAELADGYTDMAERDLKRAEDALAAARSGPMTASAK